MSLKKLVEGIIQPIVEDMGGSVAGDGTINGSPSKKKVKKNKTNKMSGYKKVNENDKAELYKLYSRAMKAMPGSPNQKKLKKQIAVLRKKLGMNEKIQSTVTSKSLRKKMDSKEWTVISHDQHWKTKKSKFLVRHNKSNKRFWVKLKEGKEDLSQWDSKFMGKPLSKGEITKLKKKLKKSSEYSVEDFNHFIQDI